MAAKSNEVSHLARLEVAQVSFAVIGKTPLMMNRMSKKVREGLLLPPKKKNKAEREATAKHDPVQEFRNSIYRNRLDDTPTACHMPGGGFKSALLDACLRIPGGNKTETGQLINIANETVFIYGTPFLHMSVVRQAGMQRTPDIRTRAIFPEWCCVLDIVYVPPLINDEIIFNILAGAGLVIGVGDGRPQKGKLSFGQFQPIDQSDPQFKRIMETGGRAAQLAAIQEAEPYDDEASELLGWYREEATRRRMDFTAPGSELIDLRAVA